MEKRRVIDIGSREIVILEGDSFVNTSTGQSLTGAWLWDAAIVLAMWFTTESWPPGSFLGKRAVELGAGTGLPGLALAALGANVFITDRQPLLEGIEANIRVNDLQARAQARELDWGAAAEHCAALCPPPVDFIVASDVMYDPDHMPGFADALHSLAGPTTRVFLCCELRIRLPDCFQMLRERGVTWTAVPQEHLHPQWRSDDIKIFELFVSRE